MLRHGWEAMIWVAVSVGCASERERAGVVDDADTLGTDAGADPGGPSDTAEPKDGSGAAPEDVDAGPVSVEVLALPSTGSADLGRFASSVVCASCHSNERAATAMRDGAGREVAPFDLWRSTMMASAARDPLWRAVVSLEVAAHPSRGADIEDKCAGCHAPMMAHALREAGARPARADLARADATGALGRDGVSCALCHQIEAGGLGAEASFTAGFALADRVAFGPHAGPFANPMVSSAGFTPAQGDHILESALCGSCHTLITDALDEAGAATGDRLLEQGPYLEWRASAYTTEGAAGPLAASCQDCHAPTADVDGRAITTRIARRPGGGDFPPTGPRAPFGRHLFVGGNTWIPALIDAERALLSPLADGPAYSATLAAARDQLGRASAVVNIGEVSRTEALRFTVTVTNLSGHKLPTGHPTRRAWLHARVLDGAGAVLFESGGFSGAGRLVGEGGAPLPSELAGGPIAPHRDVISSPWEVASWEAVMADHGGRPTFVLLSGARFIRDDRLLPEGFSTDRDDGRRTAPIGVEADPDFAPGGDVVHFELVFEGIARAARVEVELLYTPVSGRWQAELFAWRTPEMEALRVLFERAGLRPERLASDALEL